MLPLDRYRLRLWFADGREREVDLTDRLWGPVLLPLRDPTLFAGVRIDEEFGTISWPATSPSTRTSSLGMRRPRRQLSATRRRGLQFAARRMRRRGSHHRMAAMVGAAQ